MGVTSRLVRWAAARPGAYVVTSPGGTRARLGVEAELRRRGWPLVASPAAGGLLVVCGDHLEDAVTTVWDDLPNPRALARIPASATSDRIAALLDEAAALLADADAQRADARTRPGPWIPDTAHGGLPMAERGPDRDGLALDRLHVPLGPVLAHWPAGLVVRTTLQGDVIQAAEAEYPERPGDGSFWDEPWERARAGEPVTRGEAERRTAASHLDGLARLLAVAGWDAAAGPARRLRDGLLAG
ncbi:MAG TPA: hypothetical protein VHJ17_14670, partial [Thermomonospora sp.]|nr:hypothetical protein [Thermomonospora sp.]